MQFNIKVKCQKKRSGIVYFGKRPKESAFRKVQAISTRIDNKGRIQRFKKYRIIV